MNLRKKAPPRRWFAYDEGAGFYRNCPLIMAERQEIMLWVPSRRKFRLLDALAAEWQETWRRGVQYAAELRPGEIAVATPDSVRFFWPELELALAKASGPEAARAEIDRIDALPHLPGDPKYRWRWEG